MNLRDEIAEWNMTDVGAIRLIYARHAKSDDFLKQIIGIMEFRQLQRGSTWLLKHYCEQNTEPVAPDIADLVYQKTQDFEHWETKLHVLQCMSQLPISTKSLKHAERFVRQCLLSDAKFVRAWAYSGFYELAVQHHQFQLEATKLLSVGLAQENAASVKARIRRIKRDGF